MSCDTYHGANSTLLGQLETAFRTAPASPDALALKFSSLELARNPLRQDDPTIKPTVLAEKTDEVDESPTGSLTAIACLNDLLFWLWMLWGAPTTTGTGPYVHTFTLTRNCRPTALLELGMTRPSASRFRRFLGATANELNWDLLADDQNIQLALLMATQVRPQPVAAFDVTPTYLAKQRAMAAKGEVYDVSGSSTLGTIAGATLKLANGIEGMKIADGLTGYGDYEMGDPTATGTIRALFRDAQLMDFAEQHTSKTLVLKTASKDGSCSCVITFPNVEFDEPSLKVETKKGLVVECNWKAHNVNGAAAPTIVLTNGVAPLVAP